MSMRRRMALAGFALAALAAGGAALMAAPGRSGEAVDPQPTVQASRELRTVKLRVENMTCSACPYIVRKALTSVDGVVDVKVDDATKTATVVFDPQKADVSDLTAATANFGYPSTPLPDRSS